MKRRTLLRGLTGGIVIAPSIDVVGASSSSAAKEKTRLVEIFIKFGVEGESELEGDLKMVDVDERVEYKLDEQKKHLRVLDPEPMAPGELPIGSVATQSSREINGYDFNELLPIKLTDRGRTTEALHLATSVNGPEIDVVIKDALARVKVADVTYSIPNNESVRYHGEEREADVNTRITLDERVDSSIPVQKRSLKTVERVESIAVHPVVTIKNHGKVSVEYHR